MVEFISLMCLCAAAPEDTLNSPDLLSWMESAANRRSSVRSQMHLSQPAEETGMSFLWNRKAAGSIWPYARPPWLIPCLFLFPEAMLGSCRTSLYQANCTSGGIFFDLKHNEKQVAGMGG